MGKYSDFPSQTPYMRRNLQFAPQSETTSMLVTFIWESPSPPPHGRGVEAAANSKSLLLNYFKLCIS